MPHDVLILTLIEIALFFSISGIVVPLLQRIHLSPVLGYLICGIVLAPHNMSFFSDYIPWFKYVLLPKEELAGILGELGIIILMFMIGLHLSLERVWELRRYVLGMGSLQIGVTSLVLYGILYWGFSMSAQLALIISLALSLSSTAVVMQLLQEKKMSHSHHGTLTFSVLLMQDLAVVPIVILSSIFISNSNENILVELLSSFGFAIVVIGGILLIGRLVLAPLIRMLQFTQTPEWVVGLVLFCVAIASSITLKAGLSAALGAFIVGLLIAETELQSEIESLMDPVKGILMGVFFVSIGMKIELVRVSKLILPLLASVIGLFGLKAMAMFAVGRLYRLPSATSAHIAILLAQGGEFAFLVITIIMHSTLIDSATSQFILTMTALSICITPLTTLLAPIVTKFLNQDKADPESPNDISKHIVIAGLGRSGREITRFLHEKELPYIGIDHNLNVIKSLKSEKLKVQYGDIRRIKYLKSLHLNQARVVVIVIDQYATIKAVLSHIKTLHPTLPVIVLAREVDHIDEFKRLGATDIIPEFIQPTLQIMKHLIQHLDPTGLDTEALHTESLRFLNRDVQANTL